MSTLEVTLKKAAKSIRPYGTTLPSQKKSLAQKDKDWREENINAIIAMGDATYYNNRSSKYNKQVNYNIVNSIFDEKDFLYVTDPLGIGSNYGESPAKMENYNILRNVIEFLKGEELKKQYPFTAIAVNGEAISTKQRVKGEMLKQSLAQYIQNEEAKYGINQPTTDEQGNPVEPKTPEEIEKYMTYEFKDMAEIQTNHILNYLYKKEDINHKFVRGWEHGLISGEEVYYVGISYNEPYIRVVNPVYFSYDKNPDIETIEDSQWCREERFMTKGEILDEFREYLTDEDIDMLDEDSVGMGSSVSRYDALPGFSYSDSDANSANNYNNRRTQYISVNICCWKSWSKIGFFTFINPETGEEESKIVNESFKVPDEFKLNAIEYKLEWEWINEVWMGIRIGDRIYCNIAPLDNQCRETNNISKCKLPYVGRVYNATNTVSVSMVDLLKKYQYIYNILWYRLELEIAKAQGKKMIIDMAQIPISKGVNLDKFMYYLTNAGIAFINSLEEGRPGDPNSVSKFNQMGSIDMTLSASVGQYLTIINKIEESVEKVSGVSRQRLGDTFSSETATGIQSSVAQSTTITEFMFYNHNKVKEKVLNQLVEAAKIAYINNKNISYIGDDLMKVFVEISGSTINNSDIAIFITNNPQDQMIKAKLEGLFQAGLQNDKVMMSDVVKVYKSNSISEIENMIVASENKQQQRAEAQQEAQAQAQEKELQMKQFEIDSQREENQLDRDNKIQIAQINAMSFDTEKDYNKDNIPDYAQIEDVLQKRKEGEHKLRELHTKTQLEYDKIFANQKNDEFRLSKESEMQSKELKYKQEELKSKERIAKMKPKPTTKKK